MAFQVARPVRFVLRADDRYRPRQRQHFLGNQLALVVAQAPRHTVQIVHQRPNRGYLFGINVRQHRVIQELRRHMEKLGVLVNVHAAHHQLERVGRLQCLLHVRAQLTAKVVNGLSSESVIRTPDVAAQQFQRSDAHAVVPVHALVRAAHDGDALRAGAHCCIGYQTADSNRIVGVAPLDEEIEQRQQRAGGHDVEDGAIVEDHARHVGCRLVKLRRPAMAFQRPDVRHNQRQGLNPPTANGGQGNGDFFSRDRRLGKQVAHHLRVLDLQVAGIEHPRLMQHLVRQLAVSVPRQQDLQQVARSRLFQAHQSRIVGKLRRHPAQHFLVLCTPGRGSKPLQPVERGSIEQVRARRLHGCLDEAHQQNRLPLFAKRAGDIHE